MEGEAAFELKDVQVGLGARAVLQQVNLSAPIGSVTGLIGRPAVKPGTPVRHRSSVGSSRRRHLERCT